MSLDAEAATFRQHLVTSLREHWRFYLIEGIILVLLGGAAIVVPQIATLSVAIIIGWILLFSGGVGLVSTFQMRPAPGFWWSLLSALIGIVAGIVLLVVPRRGRRFFDLRIDHVLCCRGHRVDHVRPRTPPRASERLAGDARERRCRPDPGNRYFPRSPRFGCLGDRIAGRDQHDLWWRCVGGDGLAGAIVTCSPTGLHAHHRALNTSTMKSPPTWERLGAPWPKNRAWLHKARKPSRCHLPAPAR